MKDQNLHIIQGVINHDPEINHGGGDNGTYVARLTVGAKRQWKTKSGEQRESTAWMKVVAFGDLAEYVYANFKHDDRVMVIGHVNTRSWVYKGEKHRVTETIADSIEKILDLEGEAAGRDGHTEALNSVKD